MVNSELKLVMGRAWCVLCNTIYDIRNTRHNSPINYKRGIRDEIRLTARKD